MSLHPVTQQADEGARGASIRTRATYGLTVALSSAAGSFPLLGGSAVFAVAALLFGVAALQHGWSAPRWPVGLFLATIWLSVLWTVSERLTIRSAIVATAICLATLASVKILGLDRWLSAIFTSLKLLTAVSWLLYVFLPELGRQQDAYQGGAFKGLFVQRNSAAFALSLGLFLAVHKLHQGNQKSRATMLWAVLFAAGIYLTSSSTGQMVTVLCLALYGTLARVARRSHLAKQTLLVSGGSLLAYLAVAIASDIDRVTAVLGRDGTLTGRTETWEALLPAIEARPWLGYGFGALWDPSTIISLELWSRIGYRAPHAHNSYLDYAGQIGLVGLGVVALMLLRTLFLTARDFMHVSRIGTPQFIMTWVIALMVYGISEWSFASQFGLLILFGCVAGAEARTRPSSTPPTQ